MGCSIGTLFLYVPWAHLLLIFSDTFLPKYLNSPDEHLVINTVQCLGVVEVKDGHQVRDRF